MRARVLKLVVAFSETTDAIAAEEYFKNHGVEGRMIPLPSAVSAGCGLAWSSALEQRSQIEKLIEEKKIVAQGIYEIQLFERKK